MSDTCSRVNRNVIAKTKPNPNPNPNPIPYPILSLKVNHYEDVKPFLLEILSPEQLSSEQMSDHPLVVQSWAWSHEAGSKRSKQSWMFIFSILL